jgi:hypothetical protein
MDRYFEADANGQITALKLGPDHEGLEETLNAACLTYLWAAIPFAKLFEYEQFDKKTNGHLEHYRVLAQEEAG